MEQAGKRKSIFTDVVHLAGLTDSVPRESGLDLRTKSSSSSCRDQNPHRPAQSIDHKSLYFCHPAFSSSPFFSPEHFLFSSPGSLLAHSGASLPFCWPPCYGHGFLHSLPVTAPYSLPHTTHAVDAGHGGNSVVGGRSLMPGTTATTRTKQAPRFQCPDCNRVYSTFSGLSKHRQFHCAAQMKRQFGCKFCQKHYTSLGALKMHIRTHTLPCKCELCGKAFSRPWLLQGHLRTHTGEKPFRCLHCGRAFADRSNLRAHLQTHSEVKKYRCACCEKTFSRMSLLTKHENNGCPGGTVHR